MYFEQKINMRWLKHSVIISCGGMQCKDLLLGPIYLHWHVGCPIAGKEAEEGWKGSLPFRRMRCFEVWWFGKYRQVPFIRLWTV